MRHQSKQMSYTHSRTQSSCITYTVMRIGLRSKLTVMYEAQLRINCETLFRV
jgi:hypothetical protein